MSFSTAQFNSKLDSLLNTQDSIVSISQWVLFHVKHYQEIVKVWSDYFHSLNASSSSGKKLSLLYLCNDVVQQSRRKNKQEFNHEFAKVLPDILSGCYSELKPKIDRLLNVWQERKIFTTDEITAMKEALVKPQPEPQKAQPPREEITTELRFVNDLFKRLQELTKINQGNLTQLGIQSKTYLDPKNSETLPDPIIYKSKLNMLEKLGIVCISNIEEIKKVRIQIKSQLDNLSKLIGDGVDSDDVKVQAINEKLNKLKQTRDELDQEETGQVADVVDVHVDVEEDEDGEDDMPGYEPESDIETEAETETESRKRRLSQTSSGASTPKKVAFSEDVEVFEGKQEEDEPEPEPEPEQEQEQDEEKKQEEPVDVFSLLSKLAE